MATVAPKIDAQQVQDRLSSGDALLVCAYEDEQKCRSMRFGGALTLQEFERRKPTLDRSGDILLYCA